MTQRKVVASFNLFGFIVFYLLLSLLLFGLGIGTGYLLRWLLKIELGLAILISVVAHGIGLYFATRIHDALQSIALSGGEEEDNGWEEEEDEDESPAYAPRRAKVRRRRRR